MLHPLFHDRQRSEREKRLIFRTGGFRGKADDAESRIRESFGNLTNPEAARERSLISDREILDAFARPKFFTRTDRAGSRGNLPLERMLSMTPERRLQEFQRYIERNFPQAIRNLEEHAPLFSPALNEQDLREYEADEQNNRIATLLRALKTLSGETVPQEEDPAAFRLARDVLQETNNTAEKPGRLYTLYKQWLDDHPDLGKTDATTPETLLKPESGIPDELRGALESLVDPREAALWLREMFEMSTGKSMDTRLQRAQQRVEYLRLNRSVEEDKLRRETSDVLTNFRNADGRLQILTAAAGLYLGYRAFKAQNPLGRFALYGMFGWFAYDRFVNGNENAFNDMANGMKKVAQFSGEKIGDALRAIGLKPYRRPVDRINAMGDFLELHKLPVGPAMTGMACLSSVKLKTIAEAFVPFAEGDRLGGVLTIDGGDRTGMEQETDTGYLLGKALKGAMQKMGLRADEKENTFQYLGDNNLEVSKAIAHVFFLLAANRPKNIETADEIGKQLSSVGSYDNLPQNLKTRYQEMVVEGRQIAINEYPDRSLVEIVESLNSRRKTEKEKLADTAAVIDDPRVVPARKHEFQTLEETQNISPDATAKDSLLADNKLLENDTDEFLKNCQDSRLLTSDGSDELKRKFDLLRKSNSPITDIMQATEKLKYAVMVTATKDRDPLTREKIITMTGPDDLSAKAFLSRMEGYLSRYVISLPRNFHTVSSLGDVRSMLNEPWFGQGPVSSLGLGFKDLEQRIDAYQKQVQDMKDLDALGERAAGALPPAIITSFGGMEKLLSALKPIVGQSSFQRRIDRAEAHLSQRMAGALARSTALIATPDGYGRREDRLGVTPKEQGNLVKEFDLLFVGVIGRTNVWGNGMWRTIEDIEVMERMNLEFLESFDFASEDKRLESVAYARDIAILYLLRVLSGDTSEALRTSLGERARKIYDRIYKQRDKEVEKATKEVKGGISVEEQTKIYDRLFEQFTNEVKKATEEAQGNVSAETKKTINDRFRKQWYDEVAKATEKEGISVEEQNEIRRKNLAAAQLIENNPSYKSLPELRDILKLLGINVDEPKEYKDQEKNKNRFEPIVDIVTTTTTTTTTTAGPLAGPTGSTAGTTTGTDASVERTREGTTVTSATEAMPGSTVSPDTSREGSAVTTRLTPGSDVKPDAASEGSTSYVPALREGTPATDGQPRSGSNVIDTPRAGSIVPPDGLANAGTDARTAGPRAGSTGAEAPRSGTDVSGRTPTAGTETARPRAGSTGAEAPRSGEDDTPPPPPPTGAVRISR